MREHAHGDEHVETACTRQIRVGGGILEVGQDDAIGILTGLEQFFLAALDTRCVSVETCEGEAITREEGNGTAHADPNLDQGQSGRLG